MIISGTWMPIMTPVHSGYQHRLDLTSYSIPFVSDTGLFRDSINDILCLVQPRSEQILIHSFPWYSSPWPSHTLQLYGWNLIEWAPSIYPLYGLANPALVNNTPQHISTEYLRYNRYDPHISVRWWDVSQSIREDSDYARTHGQRNGLPSSVITTLNLHKIWSCCNAYFG